MRGRRCFTQALDLPLIHRERLRTVFRFGSRHLARAKRVNGETYEDHSIDAVATLREITDNVSYMSALLLHDLGKENRVWSGCKGRMRRVESS